MTAYGWGGKPNVGTGETAKQIAEKILELETREEDLRYGVILTPKTTLMTQLLME